MQALIRFLTYIIHWFILLGDIIDTWVYRAGLLNLQYELATAVGLLKSVAGFILISLSYYLAYRFTKYRIF
ncbi:beta-xyloside ABC transporter [Gracilibacillus boraciitolerans JCM 21714]|uniref:Beta-xyloside ABC transporter n=1 Tax=Gracilibacillus boraciitolerans JCM 21714 TaxID=1298598 RepID=W4VJ84_9BACI|nr:beta-xyloside ABC transporter [Gracilibacillus boraciitolerans JCM 21714]